MNVDYTLTPGPALARKLAYLRTIMRVNIDDALLRPAGEGLLTHEQVEFQLPESLRGYVNEKTLDIIQHSVDHGDRFILGCRTFAQSAAYSLMAALHTNKKVLIVSSFDQKRSEMWRAFLNTHKLEHQHIQGEKDTPDYTKQILMFERRELSATVMNKVRDRALVFVQGASAMSARTPGSLSPLNFDELLMNAFIPPSEMGDIVCEFPKAILSFHMDYDPTKAQAWWQSAQMREMVKMLHPELNIDHILSNHQAHQNALLHMGYLLSSPLHMARLLGMHLRVLLEDETSSN